MRKKVWQTTVLTLVLASILLVGGCGGGATTTEGGEHAAGAGEEAIRPEVAEGKEAVEILKEGNARFTDGRFTKKDLGEERRKTLAAGQKPFAVIVSCSDSRVPPELLFDQALGDVFVVRVAGNVVDDVARGSVEYAVEHLGAHLVVVLGHEKCGAVKATVEGGEAPGSIGSIVTMIKPSVERAKLTGASGDGFVEAAVDENVKESIASLRTSPILEAEWRKGELTYIGAKYHLESGEVSWAESLVQ